MMFAEFLTLTKLDSMIAKPACIRGVSAAFVTGVHAQTRVQGFAPTCIIRILKHCEWAEADR